MTLRDIVKASRSYRRFHEGHKIKEKALKELVDLARLSPSSANLQPLKYILSCDVPRNDAIFSSLAWAGYLKDWSGPEKGERPSAYIIILGDTSISDTFDCDSGIAAQTILLGAVEKGLGGCIIGSIDRGKLRENQKILQRYKILLVIALGRPKEKVVIEDSLKGGIKYYRDKDNIHHVPKRPLNEILI